MKLLVPLSLIAVVIAGGFVLLNGSGSDSPEAAQQPTEPPATTQQPSGPPQMDQLRFESVAAAADSTGLRLLQPGTDWAQTQPEVTVRRTVNPDFTLLQASVTFRRDEAVVTIEAQTPISPDVYRGDVSESREVRGTTGQFMRDAQRSPEMFGIVWDEADTNYSAFTSSDDLDLDEFLELIESLEPS